MPTLNPEKHQTIILIILIFFASMGPVSIDIITPSLPAIAHFFSTDNSTVQWTISIFMLGFSISTLLCGPLADRCGRKNTLLFGYGFYLLASLVILNTENIYLLIFARFIQAVFGCFGTVMARVIARDYYSDKMEVKMLAYIAGGLTIAPMAAPICGGFIQEYTSWKYNFVVLSILATFAMFIVHTLPEKYKLSKIQGKTSFLSGYKIVLTDWRFLRFTFAAGAAFSGAFVFIVGGPFVLIDQLHMSPKNYGLLCAIVIAAYILSASSIQKLNERFNRASCLKLSGSLLILGAVISLISSQLSHGQSISGYVAGVIIYQLGLGIYMPVCQTQATEHMKSHAATASGLIFFIEIMLLTIISSVIGWAYSAGMIALSSVTLAMVVLSTLCLLSVNRQRRKDSTRTV